MPPPARFDGQLQAKWRGVVSDFRVAAGAVAHAAQLIIAEGASGTFPECNIGVLAAVQKLFEAEGQVRFVQD